jgi:hypothetical protein
MIALRRRSRYCSLPLVVEFQRLIGSRIGSPESLLVPSSIEELRECCCSNKERVRTIEYESNRNLRVIGESASYGCTSLELICIPSVAFLRRGCFKSCWNLQTVTFCPESKLRLIERNAFEDCPSVRLVSVPASVEVIGPLPSSFRLSAVT